MSLVWAVWAETLVTYIRGIPRKSQRKLPFLFLLHLGVDLDPPWVLKSTA